MQKKEEYLDVYDRRGNHVGIMERSEAHKKDAGVFHKAVHIWIINSKKQLLIQRRAPWKPTCPNRWDISAAGHVEEGETLLDTCVRETYEEIGLKIPKENFIFVGEIVHTDFWEFTEQFIVMVDVKLSEMSFQDEEVSEVRWIDIPSFKRLIYTEDFMNHSMEYKFFMHRFLEQHFDSK